MENEVSKKWKSFIEKQYSNIKKKSNGNPYLEANAKSLKRTLMETTCLGYLVEDKGTEKNGLFDLENDNTLRLEVYNSNDEVYWTNRYYYGADILEYFPEIDNVCVEFTYRTLVSLKSFKLRTDSESSK